MKSEGLSDVWTSFSKNWGGAPGLCISALVIALHFAPVCNITAGHWPFYLCGHIILALVGHCVWTNFRGPDLVVRFGWILYTALAVPPDLPSFVNRSTFWSIGLVTKLYICHKLFLITDVYLSYVSNYWMEGGREDFLGCAFDDCKTTFLEYRTILLF